MKIEFLLLSVTSVLQPMDQDVVQCLLKDYHKKLVNKIVISLEVNKSQSMNVLEAIHIANTAWEAVSQDAISSYFSHVGFWGKKITACKTEPSVEESRKLNSEIGDICHLMETCTSARKSHT